MFIPDEVHGECELLMVEEAVAIIVGQFPDLTQDLYQSAIQVKTS